LRVGVDAVQRRFVDVVAPQRVGPDIHAIDNPGAQAGVAHQASHVSGEGDGSRVDLGSVDGGVGDVVSRQRFVDDPARSDGVGRQPVRRHGREAQVGVLDLAIHDVVAEHRVRAVERLGRAARNDEEQRDVPDDVAAYVVGIRDDRTT
jgi:hypothetical protein